MTMLTASPKWPNPSLSGPAVGPPQGSVLGAGPLLPNGPRPRPAVSPTQEVTRCSSLLPGLPVTGGTCSVLRTISSNGGTLSNETDESASECDASLNVSKSDDLGQRTWAE